MRDGAEVLLELLGGHADAVVADGERARVFVDGDLDLEVAACDGVVLVLEGRHVQLVEGVGGVRDQLSQEDLLVGVDGVDHHVEQFLALGFELAHGAESPFRLTDSTKTV